MYFKYLVVLADIHPVDKYLKLILFENNFPYTNQKWYDLLKMRFNNKIFGYP
jgi:hypothetical protein